MIRPPFATRNVSDNRATCFHCRNSGIVGLDERPARRVTVTPPAPGKPDDVWMVDLFWPCGQSQRISCHTTRHATAEQRARQIEANPPNGPSYGAPCPMCERGELVNIGWAKLEGTQLTYWERSDVEIARWEHGLSTKHVRGCRMKDCPTPAAGSYCNYHSDESNRGGAKVVPLKPGVSLVPSIRATDAVAKVAPGARRAEVGSDLDLIPLEEREQYSDQQWFALRSGDVRRDSHGKLVNVQTGEVTVISKPQNEKENSL